MNHIWDFLSTEGFQPHGMCLLWRPDVFWSHAVSDLVIAGSYFSIPVAMIYFAIHRPDLVYRRVLYMFCAFIVACGVTHLFGLWTLWVPDYGVEGLIKVATALVSATTAIMLWPLMPRLLAIPSARSLEEKNALLAREITEREAAEAELRSLNDRLLQSRAEAEKANIAKSEFLALMSHEVRTPLHGILATANLMTHDRSAEKQARYARTIQQSGETLLSTVNRILDLSRIEAGVVEVQAVRFKIRDLLDSVERLWESRLKAKRLDYSFRLSESVPATLIGDPERIRDILNNIVNNAVKFTHAGSIEVTVAAEPGIGGESGAHVMLRFEIADTGTGIDAAHLETIFERFEQVDGSLSREHEGSGLGLTICREFCQLLDGDIGVSSEIGKGSRFWFTVRCEIVDDDWNAGEARVPVPVPPDDDDPAAVPPAAAPLKILVAEDNSTNQMLIRDILRHLGHSVEIVSNGAEAVSAARERRYDIIFMDVRMPVMDGLDATRHIRKLAGGGPPVPIIALTAHAMTGDEERYLAAGMNAYVSKPFTLAEIAETLTRYAAVA